MPASSPRWPPCPPVRPLCPWGNWRPCRAWRCRTCGASTSRTPPTRRTPGSSPRARALAGWIATPASAWPGRTLPWRSRRWTGLWCCTRAKPPGPGPWCWGWQVRACRCSGSRACSSGGRHAARRRAQPTTAHWRRPMCWSLSPVKAAAPGALRRRCTKRWCSKATGYTRRRWSSFRPRPPRARCSSWLPPTAMARHLRMHAWPCSALPPHRWPPHL